MEKYTYLLTMIMMISITSNAQSTMPKVVSGKIDRIEHFQSKYITQRHIDIWLPEGYSTANEYAVLYMHDGQMLYDPNQTWNNQSWNVDDIASQLMSNNKIKQLIIVGIWNGRKNRHTDYFPKKPFDQLTKLEKDTVIAQLNRAGKSNEIFQPQSDLYLKFITKELKPYIDSHYAVSTSRDQTFIAGSSMGGFISLYAICEYPKIFGGAACLSTHWIGSFTLENNPIPNVFLQYLRKKLPKPKNNKIYFDCGDQTLDAFYPAIQQKVDEIMKNKGYKGDLWLTKYFPGQNHSEDAWNKRFDIPLVFLLGQAIDEK